MLSKADIKFVKSLGEKNIRYANKLFVAEGNKTVSDLISSNLQVHHIYALDALFDQAGSNQYTKFPLTVVNQKEMDSISQLQNSREVIGVFNMPEPSFNLNDLSGLVLAVDTLQDPGNLGTIIRLADWYGISTILASVQTVDCFNNKVVQSTMGSIGRVKVLYGDLSVWFSQTKLPIVAADMQGIPASKFSFPESMILLIGNEGAGINPLLKPFISNFVTIEKRGAAESLNAAMASAILVDRYFGQVGG
jgi:TrmH family RNA methyltransferase